VNSIKAAAGSVAIFVLTACGGGGGGSSSNANGDNDPQAFSVGGSVTGLSGSGLTLSSNGQTLAVAANGSFTFASAMASGTAYNVTVATQPNAPTQTCTVASGSGTLSANVSNIAITCVTATFTLGGTVSGLTGSGLTLDSNGQSLVVGADGSFVFPAPVASGSAYAVTIATQPESPAQDCGVANGSGTLTSANINNIAVTCAPLLPLSVTTRTPATGSREVARDNTLTVSFSAALNPATVSTSTVVLSNSIAGQQEIDVATSGSQITITARRKLLPATPYTLTIDTAVLSNRGQQMSAPATLSFTTREATWQTSAYIEDVTSAVRHPEIAANGDTVVAVWSEEGAGIALNQYVPGTGWSGRKPFSSGTDSNNPQVAVDSQGTSHIVWTRYQNPATNLEGTQYSAASGFATTQLVENDDVSGASAARVAIDAQDQVFALWRYGSGTSSNDGSTWFNRYVTGTGWGDINRLDSTPRGTRDARIALNPAGNAIVSWTQLDLAGRSRVFANRYVNGAGSGIPVRIDNVAASINASDSRVGIDAAGNAMAIYRFEVTTTNDAIGATRYVVGTGWTPPVTIDTSNTEIDEAQVAVDPAGNALAVWIEVDVTKEIWANRFTVGTGWGTAQRLAVATASTEGLQVAMDRAGNAVAVWMQYVPGVNDSTEIMALRYVAGAGWGTALSIDNETDDVIDPHLAFDASGNAVVVWLSYDGSVNNVRANRFE
jgi:hypothetical protein